MTGLVSRWGAALAAVTVAGACATTPSMGGSRAPGIALASAQDGDDHPSRISDEVIPLQLDDVPERPRPILELGDPFLGAGPIRPGVEIPGGGVLQPSLLVFGVARTALQAFDVHTRKDVEWANRLDLFANLQLSGTERVLLGLRPLDEDGEFTGYVFRPEEEDGFEDAFDGDVETLFFEGDLGEILPVLDDDDARPLDLGFAVGRQPLLFQEGLLINDSIDSIGITRNTLLPDGASNLRVTGLYGWNEIHRDDNLEDESTHLIGLFAEADLPASTVSVDGIWILDEDDVTDAVYLGVGAVQRIGHVNSALRVVSSYPLRDETPAAGRGTLLFAELSRTRTHSDDLVYVNGFWGIDQFSSAARGPATGGPLGRTGILFAAVGLGRYGAALGNRADDAAGGALGYQWFVGGQRQQIVLELGGRDSTDGADDAVVALGGRYQRALGRRAIVRVDAFAAGREGLSPAVGARLELLFKF